MQITAVKVILVQKINIKECDDYKKEHLNKWSLIAWWDLALKLL